MLQNEALIWTQILVLSDIMQRNMPEIKNSAQRSKDIQSIFCYLHKYIYQPKNLKANVMAAHFNLSEDYIGPYFKRNTGITLRQYIHGYRQNLIQQRIESGRFGLKQIASEFGLVDESHVSKLMRESSKS
jgi:AraC-like DNA-binding protein